MSGDWTRLRNRRDRQWSWIRLRSRRTINLARILWYEGKLDEADAAARKAAELQPNSASSRRWQVFVAIKRGDSETALREAQLEPDESYRRFELALAQYARGDRAAADAALAELIANEPRHSWPIKSRRFTPCAERQRKLSSGYKSRLILMTPACSDFWLIRCCATCATIRATKRWSRR